MNSNFVVLCGVPELECTGGKLVTDQMLGTHKAHQSRAEAFRCHKRYLLKQGFTQLSPREFVNPENKRVRILNKQSKFGALLRPGKEGSRYMPKTGRGVII